MTLRLTSIMTKRNARCVKYKIGLVWGTFNDMSVIRQRFSERKSECQPCQYEILTNLIDTYLEPLSQSGVN